MSRLRRHHRRGLMECRHHPHLHRRSIPRLRHRHRRPTRYRLRHRCQANPPCRCLPSCRFRPIHQRFGLLRRLRRPGPRFLRWQSCCRLHHPRRQPSLRFRHHHRQPLVDRLAPSMSVGRWPLRPTLRQRDQSRSRRRHRSRRFAQSRSFPARQHKQKAKLGCS